MTKSNGLFRITQPSAALEFTGERLTTGNTGQVEMEHLHRYSFARDFCVDKDVLDVAGGEGYGAMLLAGVARSVIGVERDADAVAHAQRSYVAVNLAFEQGDALQLSLPDASRDVIVSFETLEHLPDQQQFLAEVRRVLRPDGLLIISTPDRLVHSGIGMPVNPHHVFELSSAEFGAFLREGFAHSLILSQRAMVGSVLLGETGGLRSYERRDASTIEATDGVARAVYLVGLASDAPLPAVPSSLYAAERSVDSLIAEAQLLRHDLAAERVRQAEGQARHAGELRAQAAAHAQQLEVEHRTFAETLARYHTVVEQASAAEAAFQLLQGTARSEEQRLREEAHSNGQRLRAEHQADLQHCRAEAEARLALLQGDLDNLRHATGVRLGLLTTRMLSRLAGPLRRPARSTVRGGLAVVRRVRFGAGPGLAAAAPPQEPVVLTASEQMPVMASLQEHMAPAPSNDALDADPPMPANEPPPEDGAVTLMEPSAPPTAESLLTARFSHVAGYPVFRAPPSRMRVTVVTDSIGPSSLFGGVASALLLATLLANRLDAILRVVTRTDAPEVPPIRTVLASNGVALNGPLELGFAPEDGSRELDVMDHEVFLTTSWWTTRATLASVPRTRIVMLVQEDERMFYPHGDDRLLCAETLSEPNIPVIVNSRLLFDHLAGGAAPLPNLHEHGMWFEPAFPGGVTQPRGGKRRFFFYARPNNSRNLFWRGVAALDAAMAEGLFPPEEWDMFWVGKDVPEILLANGVQPIRIAGLDWDAYQAMVSTMDAGFVLMDTPHPSYPPLDLAAVGAAVLTNTHPGKASLSHYSANILMAPPTMDGLLEGLRQLAVAACADEERATRLAADRINRDWTAALEPVVSRLAVRFSPPGSI